MIDYQSAIASPKFLFVYFGFWSDEVKTLDRFQELLLYPHKMDKEQEIV